MLTNYRNKQHTGVKTKMPIPSVNTDESHDEFIARCMAEATEIDSEMRSAACEAAWEKRSSSSGDGSGSGNGGDGSRGGGGSTGTGA